MIRGSHERLVAIVVHVRDFKERKTAPCLPLKCEREPIPAPEATNLTCGNMFPLAGEAGETGLGGEELLHGGLLEVALPGDEPVQRPQ